MLEFIKKKIAVKYVILVMLCLVLSFTVLGIIVHQSQYKKQEEDFIQVGSNITSQTSRALEDWIGSQVSIVQMIAKDERVIDVCVNPQDEDAIAKRLGLGEVGKELSDLFHPKRLLDILQNFSLFTTNKRKQRIKVIPRFQQYEGANKIVERVKEGRIKSES